MAATTQRKDIPDMVGKTFTPKNRGRTWSVHNEITVRYGERVQISEAWTTESGNFCVFENKGVDRFALDDFEEVTA